MSELHNIVDTPPGRDRRPTIFRLELSRRGAAGLCLTPLVVSTRTTFGICRRSPFGHRISECVRHGRGHARLRGGDPRSLGPACGPRDPRPHDPRPCDPRLRDPGPVGYHPLGCRPCDPRPHDPRPHDPRPLSCVIPGRSRFHCGRPSSGLPSYGAPDYGLLACGPPGYRPRPFGPPGYRPPGYNLPDCNLPGYNLPGCNMHGSNLHCSNLHGCRPLSRGERRRPGRGCASGPTVTTVPGLTWWQRAAHSATRATQTLGMPTGQSPRPMTLVITAELVARDGMTSRCAPIAHCGQLSRSEQLQLPHHTIVSRRSAATSVFDHANRTFPALLNHSWRGGSVIPVRHPARRRVTICLASSLP